MKVFLQRVTSAEVVVDSKSVANLKSEYGLLLLCGFGKNDDEKNLIQMVEKVAHLRVFPNEKGRFDYSILDIEGGVVAVPQFTLYANTSKGRRPEFFDAMPPDIAKKMFEKFCEIIEKKGIQEVQKGVFGADMKVSLLNDGPVSIMLEN